MRLVRMIREQLTPASRRTAAIRRTARIHTCETLSSRLLLTAGTVNATEYGIVDPSDEAHEYPDNEFSTADVDQFFASQPIISQPLTENVFPDQQQPAALFDVPVDPVPQTLELPADVDPTVSSVSLAGESREGFDSSATRRLFESDTLLPLVSSAAETETADSRLDQALSLLNEEIELREDVTFERADVPQLPNAPDERSDKERVSARRTVVELPAAEVRPAGPTIELPTVTAAKDVANVLQQNSDFTQ